MNQGLNIRNYAGIAFGLTVGLFAPAGEALAQNTIHRNGFETRPAWLKGGFDAKYDEVAHRIDDRDPHNGRGSEFIEIDAQQGKYVHYVYAVGKALISEELRAAMWLRSNRAGMHLLARVVLPKERDPSNLDYVLTTYIGNSEDTYQQAGQWQLMELGRPVRLAKEQQQRMTNKLGRAIDFTGAYIDALVLNVYVGPGPTKVWIDDLEVGPIEGAPPVATVPDNNNPAKMVSNPRRDSLVKFEANRLMVNNRQMFFRAIRYTDTVLPVLRNAGFNTVCFDHKANAAQFKEAADLGMWIVPEFRVVNDEGLAMSADLIAKQIQSAGDEGVLFRRINGILAYEQATLVSRATDAARGADPVHPIAADVWDGMLPYSRSLNMVGVHRFPLMTTLELPRYREWLESRRRLANPGVFTWTWIQTHLPDWYAELLYHQNAQAEFKEPVGPQPEQIRLLAYTALASGCKGLAYWSDRFLADSHQGRDRLLCCALLNQEMDMIEQMLATADDPQWVDTSVIDVKAAVIRFNGGVLVIPIWQGRFAQIVPGQAAVAKLTLTIPQVPKTTQAWEISPGEVRGLKTERVDAGMRVTLPEFGLTSMVVFTADNALVGRLQDHARGKRQLAAQWSYDMARYELEKIVKIQQQLEQMGATVPDADALLLDSNRRLQKSKQFWDAKNFSEAYHEAQRALRPVRILMRAQWEKAVRGMDTPVASPFAVSYYTLPKHWLFMDQIRKSTVSPNQLRGGDFEVVPDRKLEAWRPDRQALDDVELIAERVSELNVKRVEVTELKPLSKETKKEEKEVKKAPPPKGPEFPIEGKQCAMLQIKPRDGKPAPAALERTMVALISPEVKLPPGTLVQVSGWINIPAPIIASPDGALMYDSAGGEPLAIRLTAPTAWKKFAVYRRVPASGSINVTLALTGIGTVYFDDIRIEPLVPANGIIPAGN